MPLVLNKSAAKISASVGGKMFDFVPSIITRVSKDEMKALKKVPLIARSFDNGTFVDGEAAKAISKDAKKDLKDREEKEDQEDKG